MVSGLFCAKIYKCESDLKYNPFATALSNENTNQKDQG